MLVHWLVLLAWLITITSSHVNGQLVPKQRRIGMQQRRINAQQRHRVNLQQQRVNPQHQRINHHHQNINAPPQSANAQQRTINGEQMMNTQQEDRNDPQQQIMNNPQLRQNTDQQRIGNRFIQSHHPARPNHVKAHSKDLMTQVVASALKGQGDRQQRYHDYLDNGAGWEHMSTPVRDHQTEMNIHDHNYHVHMTFGINDEETQNAKLHNQDDDSHIGDSYTGDSNLGENSLSRFMAPPVYDEEGDGYQPNRAEVDAKYEPDTAYTPKEAATEKENTEQLVDRLHSLMSPLPSMEGESSDKRESKANLVSSNKQKEEPHTAENMEPSDGLYAQTPTQPQDAPFTREQERPAHFRYEEPVENSEEHFRKATDHKEEGSQEIQRIGDKSEEFRSFHRDVKGNSNEKDEGDDDSDRRNIPQTNDNASEKYPHDRNARKKFNFRDRDNNDDAYHERQQNRRVDYKSYFRGGNREDRNRERNRERSEYRENEERRENDDRERRYMRND